MLNHEGLERAARFAYEADDETIKAFHESVRKIIGQKPDYSVPGMVLFTLAFGFRQLGMSLEDAITLMDKGLRYLQENPLE